MGRQRYRSLRRYRLWRLFTRGGRRSLLTDVLTVPTPTVALGRLLRPDRPRRARHRGQRRDRPRHGKGWPRRVPTSPSGAPTRTRTPRPRPSTGRLGVKVAASVRRRRRGPGRCDLRRHRRGARQGRHLLRQRRRRRGGPPAFLSMTADEWRRVLRVNLDGAFFTLQAAVRHMVERGEGGSVVVTTSGSAFQGQQKGDHHGLRGAVVLALLLALERRARGGHHHAPALAALHHVPHGGLQGEEGAVEVDAQHPPPLVGRHGQEAAGPPADAGVGEAAVDLAELGDGAGEGLLDLRPGHPRRTAAPAPCGRGGPAARRPRRSCPRSCPRSPRRRRARPSRRPCPGRCPRCRRSPARRGPSGRRGRPPARR